MRVISPVSSGEMREEELMPTCGCVATPASATAGGCVARPTPTMTARLRESMGEALARISRCELLGS